MLSSARFLKPLCLLFMCVSAPALVAQQMLPTNVEEQQLADAVAQTTGEFETVNLNYINSLGMQQKAWNDPMAHMGDGQLKPGYSRYTWTPDVVLPLRLREGMMTLINLPTWEVIEKVHLGSPEAFGGEIPAANSLLLYADPGYVGTDTNMIIFGRSGNRYVFYLRSETYNTSKITQSVVDIVVPKRYTPVSEGGTLGQPDGVSTTVASGKSQNAFGSLSKVNAGGGYNGEFSNSPAWLGSLDLKPEDFRFDIDMYILNPEYIDIAPENVWHDKVFTYIDFGSKAINMLERPVVNLVIQESEVPVGFRTVGENSRMIVVEAVGDLVLRNGKKIICLKLRKNPTRDFENVSYSKPTVNLSPTQGSSEAGLMTSNPFTPNASVAMASAAGLPMQNIPTPVMQSNKAGQDIASVINSVKAPSEGVKGTVSAPVPEVISVELATNSNIVSLEKTWDKLVDENADLLATYEPFYSIDSTADGQVLDVFRLRAGPMNDVKTADTLCKKLSERKISCSVVKVQ